jgi:ribose 5-phosphate isomerase A
MVDVEKEKKLAALRSMEFIEDGMTVGLGSGSTARYFVKELGRKIREGMNIRGVPTSGKTSALAREEGIPLIGFSEIRRLDVTVDGADEVDPNLNLIKGGGGALLREKIVASATQQLIVVCDSRKPVEILGTFPLPVEVVSFGWQLVADRIGALGCQVEMRKESPGKPFLTAENNYILDCHFWKIPDPEALAIKLERMTGVVEHGLFVGLADLVIVGKGNGTEILTGSGGQPIER